MGETNQKTKRFYLKWPWNLVVYILLALFLRILAIPIILALMARNKKQQPDGPEEGYCLQRTRQRLTYLLWAALFLFIALALLVFFGYTWLEDKSRWEITDYVPLIFSGVLGVGALLAGVYVGFVGIRDTFFPEKSTLAKSIRSQLPYPDEAPPVKELFAMVDNDIKANGTWFDRVAVGNEWVLGDEASYIPRIRVVFGRDEIQRHHSNGRTTTTRIIQVYIMDDRHQVQISDLKDPNELPMLLDCLKLRAPDALFLHYSEYTDYLSMDDGEWESVERDYRDRKAKRESATAQTASQRVEQNMILTFPDGTDTSRVTEDLVRQTLAEALGQVETLFTLTPSCPVEDGGKRYTFLQCVVLGMEDEDLDEEDRADEAEIYLMTALAPAEAGQPPEEGLVLQCDAKQAETILLAWLRGKAPNTADWVPTDIRPVSQRQKQQDTSYPPKLLLFAASGAGQSHERFTREDVEVGADGIVDGSYQQVELTLPGGYLWIQVKAGDKTDGRCTVTATWPDGAVLRYYTAKCTHRQAAAWLMDYYDGKLQPGGADWKDITRKMTKK